MSGKNLRDSVLDALRSAKGNPLSKSQLSRGLKLPGARVTELRDTLDALVAQINLDADQARAHFRDHCAVPLPATGGDPAL